MSLPESPKEAVKIVVMGYEASRLEFFEEQKKLHEQKLQWWKHQKPYKQYSSIYIHEKCSKHGAAIQYLSDAINAFKMSGGENNRND